MQKIGIVGCGLMGSGIAEVTARAGCDGRMRRTCGRAFAGHLDENISEVRDAVAQLVEFRLRNDHDVHGGARANPGVSGPSGKYRHFSEILAAAQRRQELLLAVALAQHVALPRGAANAREAIRAPSLLEEQEWPSLQAYWDKLWQER